MIAIIADDFSGAAELAGIAATQGFKAEVHTKFAPESDADVIAVDTNTRLLTADEAARITGKVTQRLVRQRPLWIYKKTDSVMRGHVRAEIEAILNVTGQKECLFIPANPSKGRVIVDGRYFIGDTPLDQTLFAHDPHFPRRSSVVGELLGPSKKIRIPNTRAAADLDQKPDACTLPAGAADFFESLLRHEVSKMAVPSSVATSPSGETRALLLCGSLAAWEQGRAEEMRQGGFIVQTLGEDLPPDLWRSTRKLMLAIGRPAQTDGAILTERLIDSALPLIVEDTNLRIGLEGGATAMALIRRIGWTRFEVIPEGHLGVGTLRPRGGPVLCVKPGSYPWPAGCL
ncbi:MAG: four-carbon acid sugar kinase family protein [Prosthecobacter sp.]